MTPRKTQKGFPVPATSTLLKGIGWIFIVFYCLGNVFFYKKFVEIHLVIPGLGLPVFLGEILLALCVLLMGPQWINYFRQKNKWIGAYAIFFAFILIKTYLGYREWGLLAFRHAALFYYSLFFVIAFGFYDSRFVRLPQKALYLLLIVSLLLLKFVVLYYLLPAILLYLVVLVAIKSQRVKRIFFVLLFVFIPYTHLFDAPRTCVVSNTVAFSFMIFSGFYFLKIKKAQKVGILVLLFVLWGILAFFSGDRVSLRSLFMKNEIISRFKAAKIEIVKREKDFVPQTLEHINIFYPEAKEREVKLALAEAARRSQAKVSAQELEISTESVDLPVQGYSPHVVIEEMPQNNEQELVIKAAKRIAEKKAVTLLSSQIVGESQESLPSKQTGGDSETAVVLKSAQTIKKAPISGSKEIKVPKQESDMGKYELGNIIFRLVIWDDLTSDLKRKKPLLGFDFGKPFRSRGIEVMNWGRGEWVRDGWISMHNSYLDMIYRSGIVGVIYVGSIFWLLFLLIKRFIIQKSFPGICLTAILIYWIIASNFMPILEMPYNAVFFWILFGAAFAYSQQIIRPKA